VRVLLDVSAVPTRPVGAGVYTIAIARGMSARRDIDMHLLTRRGDAARWREIAATAELHPLAPNRRPTRLAWEQAAGPRVARRIRPDVWHGPHYTMPLRAAVPTVVAMHDLTFFDHPEWHEHSKVVYFRRMIAAAARRAEVIVTGSNDAAAGLRARFRLGGEIIVIHHGVDHARFAPTRDNSTGHGSTGHDSADLALLARHGIERPYVAFASTIEPRKDVPTLVRAFARIAAAHRDLQLVVAGGDGWGVADARAAIAASGVATRILRPGYVDDATLAALFRRAEVIAYPSLVEGFGMPALEALASGTPLVTTSGSALEEVVGDAALLVPPADPGALARALSTVLDDATVSARLRAAGPARAATFTWERSIDAHVDAYRHAIERRAIDRRGTGGRADGHGGIGTAVPG
jgi:glycosyltransferase involved in cell wall biosynthesis